MGEEKETWYEYKCTKCGTVVETNIKYHHLFCTNDECYRSSTWMLPTGKTRVA